MSRDYYLQRLKNEIVEEIKASFKLEKRNPGLYEYLRSMQVLDGFSMVDKRYNELLKEWKNDKDVQKYGKLILEKGYDEALKEFLGENCPVFKEFVKKGYFDYEAPRTSVTCSAESFCAIILDEVPPKYIPEVWEKMFFECFVKGVKKDIFPKKRSIKSREFLESPVSSAISGEYIKKDEEIYGRWGLRFLFEALIHYYRVCSSHFHEFRDRVRYWLRCWYCDWMARRARSEFKKWYDAIAYAQMIESKEKGGKLKEIMRKILRKEQPFKYGDLLSRKKEELKIQAYEETFKNMKRKGGNNLLVFIREENKEKEKMKLLDMVVDKMIRDHIDNKKVDERIKEAYYAVFERAVFGKGDKSKIRRLLKLCNDDEDVLRYAIIEALKRRDGINFSNFDDFLWEIKNIIYNIQRSQVQKEGS